MHAIEFAWLRGVRSGLCVLVSKSFSLTNLSTETPLSLSICRTTEVTADISMPVKELVGRMRISACKLGVRVFL